MRYEVVRVGPGLTTKYVEAGAVSFVEGWVVFVAKGVVSVAFPARTVIQVTLVAQTVNEILRNSTE